MAIPAKIAVGGKDEISVIRISHTGMLPPKSNAAVSIVGGVYLIDTPHHRR